MAFKMHWHETANFFTKEEADKVVSGFGGDKSEYRVKKNPRGFYGVYKKSIFK